MIVNTNMNMKSAKISFLYTIPMYHTYRYVRTSLEYSAKKPPTYSLHGAHIAPTSTPARAPASASAIMFHIQSVYVIRNDIFQAHMYTHLHARMHAHSDTCFNASISVQYIQYWTFSIR